MPLRLKKMLGSLFICVFVLFWVWAAASLSVFVPDNKVAELLFYAVAGLGWGLPILPILSWMEREKRKAKAGGGPTAGR
jgi:hypothetical protein